MQPSTLLAVSNTPAARFLTPRKRAAFFRPRGFPRLGKISVNASNVWKTARFGFQSLETLFLLDERGDHAVEIRAG
jgi:hypothetical protein